MQLGGVGIEAVHFGQAGRQIPLVGRGRGRVEKHPHPSDPIQGEVCGEAGLAVAKHIGAKRTVLKALIRGIDLADLLDRSPIEHTHHSREVDMPLDRRRKGLDVRLVDGLHQPVRGVMRIKARVEVGRELAIGGALHTR